MLRELKPFQAGQKERVDPLSEEIRKLSQMFFLNLQGSVYGVDLTRKEMELVSAGLRRFIIAEQGD